MLEHENLYPGREQSLVKHLILQRYLERFSLIIGQHWNSITYVDCFSGPWQTKSDSFADSSFGIAIQELRRARDTVQERFGKAVRLRCFFLEADFDAYARLAAVPSQYPDVEIQTRNATLEDSVDDIVRFVNQDRRTFPFILIDPKGWTGFAIDVIRPLLRLDPGEVLMNFMIEFIRRFWNAPDEKTRQSFVRLFGSEQFREELIQLPSEERDDAAAFEYLKTVQREGNFPHASLAVVLHPDIDRRFFYLPYLTRHPKGIEVFKDAEKRSMQDMERLRAGAMQRKRTRKRGPELFRSEEVHDPRYFDGLRDRYLSGAKVRIQQLLVAQQQVPYDEIWKSALAWPLVWESDVKVWIADWLKEGSLQCITGMKPRQKVPLRGSGNILVWRSVGPTP